MKYKDLVSECHRTESLERHNENVRTFVAFFTEVKGCLNVN